MENPRRSGAMLLLGGALVFLGITYDLLPSQFFPVGALMAPAGLLLFLKGNHEALEQAEARVKRIRNPQIRSVTADAFAEKQAQNILELGDVGAQMRTPPPEVVAELAEQDAVVELAREAIPRAGAPPAQTDEIELDSLVVEGGADSFKISTDVSFPVEVQETRKISDEIEKLQRLLEDGIIDEREFSAAKAKLLS